MTTTKSSTPMTKTMVTMMIMSMMTAMTVMTSTTMTRTWTPHWRYLNKAAVIENRNDDELAPRKSIGRRKRKEVRESGVCGVAWVVTGSRKTRQVSGDSRGTELQNAFS